MAQPVQDQRPQQIGAAQEGAVGGRGPADNHMVAAPRAGVLAVDHELVRAKPDLPRLSIDGFRGGHAFVPACGGMDVHLDHAGVGGDADHVHPWVMRRGVAFDMYGQPQLGRSRFGGGDQFQVILDPLHRGHEHAEPPVARFHRQGRAHCAAHVADHLLDPVLHRLGSGKAGAGLFARLWREVGQGAAFFERVGGDDMGEVGRLDIGQRAQRQAVADGAVARHQKQMPAPQRPFFGQPRFLRPRLPALHRQHKARRFGQPAPEDAGDAVALLGVLQTGVFRGDVFRQIAFLDDPVCRVLIGRHHVFGRQAQFCGDGLQQRLRLRRRHAAIGSLGGDQGGVMPDRLAVAPPVQRKGPARQGFAGIPLALTVMQETARRETVAQPADQVIGKEAFGGADGIGVPFARLEIIDGNKGRLAPHGQAHIARRQRCIHFAAQRVKLCPGGIGKGHGDARVFGHAGDTHVKGEIDLGKARQAGNRGGIAVMRGGGQRDMAFAGQKAAGRVQPDPAGTRQIDLGPGVQVGEIHLGSRGAVQRLEVRLQLDQIARNEAGGKAQVAQRLHQKPA